MNTLIAIADDGTRIYAGEEDGEIVIWGENFLGLVRIQELTIQRSIDRGLPPGEYPADRVEYVPE